MKRGIRLNWFATTDTERIPMHCTNRLSLWNLEYDYWIWKYELNIYRCIETMNSSETITGCNYPEWLWMLRCSFIISFFSLTSYVKRLNNNDAGAGEGKSNRGIGNKPSQTENNRGGFTASSSRRQLHTSIQILHSQVKSHEKLTVAVLGFQKARVGAFKNPN